MCQLFEVMDKEKSNPVFILEKSVAEIWDETVFPSFLQASRYKQRVSSSLTDTANSQWFASPRTSATSHWLWSFGALGRFLKPAVQQDWALSFPSCWPAASSTASRAAASAAMPGPARPGHAAWAAAASPTVPRAAGPALPCRLGCYRQRCCCCCLSSLLAFIVRLFYVFSLTAVWEEPPIPTAVAAALVLILYHLLNIFTVCNIFLLLLQLF